VSLITSGVKTGLSLMRDAAIEGNGDRRHASPRLVVSNRSDGLLNRLSVERPDDGHSELLAASRAASGLGVIQQ
jgi:hypothetical protein